MEVFIVSTPTYSGNYKANLEGLRVELERHASASDRGILVVDPSCAAGCAALAPPEHRRWQVS